MADVKTCVTCGKEKPVEKYAIYDARTGARRARCHPCYLARRRELSSDPGRRRKAREKRLKKNFGISLEKYEVMYRRQDGCCAICGTHRHTLHVDHHHPTGRLRKLLCFNCNTGLGHFREDPAILSAALAYVLEA